MRFAFVLLVLAGLVAAAAAGELFHKEREGEKENALL